MAEQNIKEGMADRYAREIEANPFVLDSNMDVFAAKAAAKKERLDRINIYKSVSVTKRLDFASRNAMLSLKEDSPPQFLSNSVVSDGYRTSLTRTGVLKADSGYDPQISGLAEGKRAEVLDYRAPAFTGKYAALCDDDREILESLPRQGGADTKLDDFLSKQKDIFLVELSLQTKQYQIDMLDSDVKRREAALQSVYTQYERDVQQFDKSVRQSDYQTIQSVLQQEYATRDRRARYEQITQVITQIYQLYSEIARHELALHKFCKYKTFVAELFTPAERVQFEHDERCFASMRKAVAISCREFDTCDGLCLDCFANIAGHDPDGVVRYNFCCNSACGQALDAPDQAMQQKYQESAELPAKQPHFPAEYSTCLHRNAINYQEVQDDDIRYFLTEYRPIRESKQITLRELADACSYEEYFNFPTYTPGLDDYTAVCIQQFVKQPADMQFNSSFEFINTMRLIESNNFYLVENLYDTDYQGERQKQKTQTYLKTEQDQIAQLKLQLERLAYLGDESRRHAVGGGELTESEYSRQVSEIYHIDQIVKNGYQQVVYAILEQLKADPAVERLTAYQYLADPQSIGSLSMLSWMEGNLERINTRLAGVDARERFIFERSRERARRKREEALRVAAKELARYAKIKKTQERSKEPIRQCDVRDVKFVSYDAPKRVVGQIVRESGDEAREVGFYD